MSFRCLQAAKAIDMTSPDFQAGQTSLCSTGLRIAARGRSIFGNSWNSSGGFYSHFDSYLHKAESTDS